MTSEEIVQILQDTKERLFTRGWMKFSLGYYDGPNCLLGALGYVATDNAARIEALQPIRDEIPEYGGLISSFNNDPGTTFDDIINTIDRAIKGLE